MANKFGAKVFVFLFLICDMFGNTLLLLDMLYLLFIIIILLRVFHFAFFPFAVVRCARNGRRNFAELSSSARCALGAAGVAFANYYWSV